MKKTTFASILIILSLLILVSCSFSTQIKSLKLNKDTFKLEVGQTEKLNLIIDPVKALTAEIIWSVSDKDIASSNSSYNIIIVTIFWAF
jgi:uncharacterized protein YjdB